MCRMELTSLLHPTPPHGQCIPVTLGSGTATITRATNTSLSHRLCQHQSFITHTITRDPAHHKRTHTKTMAIPRARNIRDINIHDAVPAINNVCRSALPFIPIDTIRCPSRQVPVKSAARARRRCRRCRSAAHTCLGCAGGG